MNKAGVFPISELDPISIQLGEKSLIDFSTARSILNFHVSVFITLHF